MEAHSTSGIMEIRHEYTRQEGQDQNSGSPGHLTRTLKWDLHNRSSFILNAAPASSSHWHKEGADMRRRSSWHKSGDSDTKLCERRKLPPALLQMFTESGRTESPEMTNRHIAQHLLLSRQRAFRRPYCLCRRIRRNPKVQRRGCQFHLL